MSLYPMLPVSLDCPFLIAQSVFSNVCLNVFISVAYRIVLNFTDILYTTELDNKDSDEYKAFIKDVQDIIAALYTNVIGLQYVNIVEFT